MASCAAFRALQIYALKPSLDLRSYFFSLCMVFIFYWLSNIIWVTFPAEVSISEHITDWEWSGAKVLPGGGRGRMTFGVTVLLLRYSARVVFATAFFFEVITFFPAITFILISDTTFLFLVPPHTVRFSDRSWNTVFIPATKEAALFDLATIFRSSILVDILKIDLLGAG